MKKIGILLLLTGGFMLVGNLPFNIFSSRLGDPHDSIVVAQFFKSKTDESQDRDAVNRYPEFYRGIYLNVSSANNFEKLKGFVTRAKAANINVMVLDVQSANNVRCMVPAEHVRYCRENGIHPIARIVVFPDGLRNYPVPRSYLDDRLSIAEDACKNGFTELQFDYIRFHDSGSTKHLTYSQRYRYIEEILASARARVKKYNVRIAADVFGRIPLNKDDIIGQNMESLDRVVDLICPMAYPSHYTWSKKFYADPYYTVHVTSTQAKLRAKNAKIVTYIQAFKMKMSGIPYEKYIREQLKAVHDSGIKGFIMWNARQDYDIPFAVSRSFYTDRVSKKDKPDNAYYD